MLFNFQSFKNLEPRFLDFEIAENSGFSSISKILQRRTGTGASPISNSFIIKHWNWRLLDFQIAAETGTRGSWISQCYKNL